MLWKFNTDHTLLQNPLCEYLIMIQDKTRVLTECSQQVLPYVIQRLQAAGYRLVTLSECTGLPPYQSTQPPGTRDVSYQMLFINFI